MSLHQLITRSLAANSQGSSSSCWAFLPSTCTLALFQAGGKLGQLSQAPHPNATSSQRQREDVSSSVSSGVRRSRPSYRAKLDHMAVVSVRVQVDNEGHSMHSGYNRLDTELGVHVTAGRAGNSPWWSGGLSLRELSLKHHLSVWFLKSLPGSCWQSLTCSHA